MNNCNWKTYTVKFLELMSTYICGATDGCPTLLKRVLTNKQTLEMYDRQNYVDKLISAVP